MRTTSFIAAATTAIIAFGSISFSANAQQQTAPPPCTTDENFRAFDFWIGEWEVTPWGGGNIAGHNTIEPVERGCALSERWTNAAGGTGRSINYYNPITGKWRQLWVAGGYSIDIEGGLEEGAMALEGSIHYYAQKNSVPFRGTWTPQEDGSVRQLFHQYNAETENWDVWFDGRYVRKSAD